MTHFIDFARTQDDRQLADLLAEEPHDESELVDLLYQREMDRLLGLDS